MGEWVDEIANPQLPNADFGMRKKLLQILDCGLRIL
jgi:hypothetical protein